VTRTDFVIDNGPLLPLISEGIFREVLGAASAEVVTRHANNKPNALSALSEDGFCIYPPMPS
jgi:hypothetical protein